MPLAALLTRALRRTAPPPPPTDSAAAAAVLPGSKPKAPTPPAAPPAPRRRLSSTGWRRVLVDTGALHYARFDSRTARYGVLAAAAGLPADDFMREVKARYAAVLKRDDRGRRPMEIDDFAARLRVLASADPDAAARLADVRLQGDEAERRASVAHRRKAATDKAAAARGMAAVLAAGALVGATIDDPADPAAPPAA